MDVDEAIFPQTVVCEKGIRLLFRLRSGHQHQPLLGFLRVDADAPQRIQIRFHRMPRGLSRQRVVVREAGTPKPVAVIAHASHRGFESQ